MDKTVFKAGAGTAEIKFPPEMFPTDHLYGVHDVPHARMLLLESGKKAAIVSLELVNVSEDVMDTLRKEIEVMAGVPYENIWLHVTHAITTPHTPGGPMGPKPKGPKPAGLPDIKPDPDAGKKKALYAEALKEAVMEACRQSCESLCEARIGIGEGQCMVNVNRDLETPHGWWTAQNPDELSNHTMTVLKLENMEGKVLALLISYGLKPCAIDMAGFGTETRMVSADVSGYVCAVIEDCYDAPCLFCMSAAGDQVPRMQAYYDEVRGDGSVGHVDLGVAKGNEIIELLGTEMARAAVNIAEDIECSASPAVDTGSCTALLTKKQPTPFPMKPRKELEYKPDGAVKLTSEIIALGDLAIVAVKPEVNAKTELELQEKSCYGKTLLISMVNGGMKYMPDRDAYDKIKWEAQSSMLMPGSAEKWVDRVAEKLERMKAGREEPVITAVAEAFPDGQRITKAKIVFAGEVPDVEAITVLDRTIIKRELNGNEVVLSLSLDDKAANVIPEPERPPFGGPPPFGEPPPMGGPAGGPPPFGGPPPMGGPAGGPPPFGGPPPMGGPGGRPPILGKSRKEIAVELMIPGFKQPLVSCKTEQPVIDDFVGGEYKDILYNLYIPKDYDSGKKYPLVVFIPDASANGNEAVLALAQGIGGTCWAEASEQAKHPCIVLAVQIPSGIILTNDQYQVSPEFDMIKELIDKVIDEYAVDTNRIYTTGQSQGCMASCEMNVRYPDLFAASLLVAGHWDIQKMTALTNSKFMFGLSEGGLKEYPNFNAITVEFVRKGIDVGTVRLNYREGWEINEEKVRRAIEGKQMGYVIFDKATAFPDDGKQRPDMAHHNRGWELVYQLESVRDWLFAQHK